MLWAPRDVLATSLVGNVVKPFSRMSHFSCLQSEFVGRTVAVITVILTAAPGVS